MVRIERIRIHGFSLRFTASLIIALWALLVTREAYSQDAPAKRKVEILHSDEMQYDRLADRSRNKLNGNVRLKHDDLFMSCDSAWYYDETNQVFAFSNIHIWQGDTIHIWGQYLSYDGNTGKAVMTDSVELADKEMRLFTREIDYDVNTQVAVYDDGGRILNGDNTLTSRTGIYYSDLKMMHFRDSVRIVNPDYVMLADTMRYDTHNEIAWFAGPTEVTGDSIYLYCEKGWSDTRNDVSQLMINAVLDNREQRITGDTLWYDERSGEGEGFGNVVIEDTTDNIMAGGSYAWYVKRPERFLLTGSPWFTLFSDDDTLTLRSDTLRAIPQADTAGITHRLLKSYYGCTMFSREMQGRCDSLSYSFMDSVIRLYRDPIVWSRENQLTADSIFLFTKESKADHMELYNKAFVVSEVDSTRYDQISGKNLSGYFIENKLHRIQVTGNGEAVYYVVDGNELVGVNRARSATIEIFIEDGKIAEIYQNQSPDGTLDPPLKKSDAEMRLDGFRWHPDLRPSREKHHGKPGTENADHQRHKEPDAVIVEENDDIEQQVSSGEPGKEPEGKDLKKPEGRRGRTSEERSMQQPEGRQGSAS